MKRSFSDSEYDIYSGDEKDIDDGTSEGGSTRKRRRGQIEKRRRDRINNSLSELRRLVPAAFEKQGSAKLEKAEILQMTVDHLKMLHAKGLDALAYDPNKFSLEYHNIGFRECTAEVARYLVSMEGMDIQDPLRLRLMSHLQCFASQRELANKQTTSSWGWGTAPTAPASTYNPAHSLSSYQNQFLPSHPTVHPTMPPASHHIPSVGLDQSHGVSAFSAPMSTPSDVRPSCSLVDSNQVSRLPTTGVHYTTSTASMPTTTITSQPPTTNYHLNLNAHTFPSNPASNLGLSSLNPGGYNVAALQSVSTAGGVKPYRPWGAEIAY